MVSPPPPGMIISWSFILTFYFVSLFLFFNYNNPLIFWVLMEINLLSFSLIFLLDKEFSSKQDRLNYLVFYFLIQSRASILFLSNFFFRDWGSIFNADHIFLFSIILKIGLFPLFFWVFNISFRLSFIRFFFLFTTQKVPLFLGLFCSGSSLLFLFLLISFFWGRITLLYRKNFIFLIISSSISYRFILFLFFRYSLSLFLRFFLLYRFFLALAIIPFFKGLVSNEKFLLLVYSFFMGLPPLSLFFFKFLFSSELVGSFGFSEMLIFWLLSLAGLVGYLKFFYRSFYEDFSLYTINEFRFKKISFILIVSSFFLVFLC